MSPDATDDPLVGTTLDGRYALEARIGRGGMGDVYRGRHLMMNQRVAVKVLRPDLAHDEAAAKRFAREARSAFRIDHPNSVRVFDFAFDSVADVIYLVMEYVDGRTVGDELQIDGPVAGARAAHVLSQVCAVLEQAHAAHLVHRDLKPDNIMLLRRGDDPDFVKVLDFGLAKLFEPDSAGTTMFSIAAVTQEGTVFGTPEYMSPEQATGQPLDPRADLYSLGIVLYQMLTGVLPFEGPTFMATLSKQVREIPVPPRQRRPELAIAPELDALVLRLIAKKPVDRPAGAREVRAELDRIASALVARPSRLPSALAASETVEMSASQVDAQAARTAGTPLPELSTAGMARAVTRRRPALWLALAASIAVVAILVAVGLSGGGEAKPTAAAGPAALPTDAGPIARVPAAAGPTLDAAAPGPDAGPPDGGVADARRPRARPRGQSRPIDPAVTAHFTAAAAARKAGNSLKEIAELHAILKISPRNREAAYLLGVALLRSGDKPRGCEYLQRAGRLRKARAKRRSAGCDD